MQFNINQHRSDNRSSNTTQHGSLTSTTGYLGGIDKSDVPFVYHHLRKGCILNLNSITTCQKHLMFAVNYGTYRIGTLNSSMSQRILDLQSAGKPYRLTITEVVKEKYMPPTAIIVELESESVPLADVA